MRYVVSARVGALGGAVFGSVYSIAVFVPVQDFTPIIASTATMILMSVYGLGGAAALLFRAAVAGGRARLLGKETARFAPRRLALDAVIVILGMVLVYELWRTRNLWMFLIYLSVNEEHNDVMKEVGERNDLVLVDLAKDFPAENRSFFSDWVHLNSAGTLIKSRLIHDTIVKYQLIEKLG